MALTKGIGFQNVREFVASRTARAAWESVGWGGVDVALCRELVGYLGRTLELLGGRDVTMEHRRCRARGDSICEFHATFRAANDRPEPEVPASDAASKTRLSTEPPPASAPMSRASSSRPLSSGTARSKDAQ